MEAGGRGAVEQGCGGAGAPRAVCASPSGRDPESTLLHQVVRGQLSSFLAEAADRGGLPRFVGRDFTRYLACGVLAHGFARLACRTCRAEVLVPFSCKSRGVCPSCNARRAHDTALHLVERVLPRAPYRQWTLSFPVPLRFCLARDARLLSEALALFVRALVALQKRTARRLGVPRPHTGAVAFVQRFGSALQLTPHFHVLLPEAVFEELGDGTPGSSPFLRPPTPRWSGWPSPWHAASSTGFAPAASLSRRLPRRKPSSSCSSRASRFRPPGWRPGRRCAFVQGFSLHANTWLHDNDVLGLQRLCSYGARGPLSLERLSELPDGRLAYRMKRPSPTGAQHLILSPLAFLRRLAAFVPPPRVNLVRYFGLFAPNARLRPSVVPAPLPPAALTDDAPPPPPQTPAPPRRPRRPIPWAELLRRSFGADVLHCPRFGGTRHVVAVVLRSSTAQAILEHLRLPSRPLPLAPATSPPQLTLW